MDESLTSSANPGDFVNRRIHFGGSTVYGYELPDSSPEPDQQPETEIVEESFAEIVQAGVIFAIIFNKKFSIYAILM